jgi:alpha-maltose-1-phosphate synthase
MIGNSTGTGPGASPGPRRLRVGMAVYGDITHDSRVRREAEALARAGHEVLLACLAGAQPTGWSPAGIRVLALLPSRSSALPGSRRTTGASRPLRAFHLTGWIVGYVANVFSWGREVADIIRDVDVWHLHDLPALIAIAHRVPRTTPLVYDSHELYLDTGLAARLPAPLRSLLYREEGLLVRRADTLITVNDALEEVLRRRYRPRRTAVVYNSPPRCDPHPGPDLLRGATGAPAEAPIVIHHGLLAPARRLELLVEAMLEPGLDRAHLVLLGYGPLRDSLVAASRERRFGGRVHVLDAVQPEDVVKWISTADVEAVTLPGINLNARLSTPNKLFESLAAGVPPVVSDLPGMRKVVLDPAGALGAVCDPGSPTTIAHGIRAILDLPPAERAELRRRCLDAAARRWNWEVQVRNLVSTYDRLARDFGPGARRG